jgi:hypothetical protein
MKTYGVLEVQLRSFLTSALDACEHSDGHLSYIKGGECLTSLTTVILPYMSESFKRSPPFRVNNKISYAFLLSHGWYMPGDIILIHSITPNIFGVEYKLRTLISVGMSNQCTQIVLHP